MSSEMQNDPVAVHYHVHYHSGQDDEPDRKSEPQNKSSDGKDENPHKSNDENSKSDDKPEKDGKPEEKMPPQKKRLLVIVALIVGLILIAGGVLYWLHARRYETTDDAFIDGHISQISPQVSGRILNLLIVDNQQVAAGQLLLEIDPRDYEEALARSETQYQQAIAQVELQKANIQQAEANIAVADADNFQAQQDLKRFKAVNPDAITRQQLDNAIAAARSAQAKLDASRQAAIAARAQEAAAEADVKQAEVAVSDAKLQLSYTRITAPIAGHITRRTVEVGNVVSPGVPLLAVASNELWVTANYKETQLDHMRIGQPVRIEIDAFPDVKFSGHIDSFQKGTGSVFSTLPAENATGNYVKVVQRVPVKIVFDDAGQRDKYPLAPGLSVDPRVKVR